MTLPGPEAPRDYEETLRSLGQVFDAEGFQDVMLFERGTGFLVTALRPQQTPSEPGEVQRRYEVVETVYTDYDIEAASSRGISRRGTRHRADRNELAFRLIGRHVNLRGGSHILVVDQGGDFLLRMLVSPETDMPLSFSTITSTTLERMRQEAIGLRSRLRTG